MHDTHNLAWKLAAVLHRQAGAARLDTYQQERQPVGARNADETTSQWRRFASPQAPLPPMRDIRQIDMGYQYHSSAVVPDGSPDADRPGTTYTQTAAPGCRAPHVRTGSRSTIDLKPRLASAGGRRVVYSFRYDRVKARGTWIGAYSS
jgi:putative polyketide hydroxylase